MRIPGEGPVYEGEKEAETPEQGSIPSFEEGIGPFQRGVQFIALGFAALCVLLLSGSAHLQPPRTPSIFFEQNRGQAQSDVRFLSRGAGYNLAFTPDGSHVSLRNSGKLLSFRTTLLGANSNPAIRGEEKQSGKANYFRGDRSITDIPTYGRIRYDAIYPGIDLVYYGNQRELEYDFVVRPRAAANSIALRFDGIESLALNSKGDLLVQVDGTAVVQQKPVVYQEYGKTIDGQYRLISANTVGFDVGPYDHSKALIIDPVLSYSTFLGGNGDDDPRSIATDAAGNVYITGSTTSTDFAAVGPIQPGNQDPTGATSDAFVMKLNASGTALLYSTYLGGADDDVANKIAVDAAGNAIIAGWTTSLSFPTTAGALSRVCSVAAGGSCLDAFVAKLNAEGSALAYSTYLGGTGDDQARGLAVDSGGNAYITGTTASTNFPVTGGALSTDASSGAFVTKLSVGGAMVYSTYLGAGSGAAEPNGIAVDAAGNAYIAGTTASSAATGTDVFITKLNPAGTAAVFTQFLRGAKDDAGTAVAVDNSGNVYVTGKTFSVNFPTTLGVVQPASAGPLFRSLDAATTWSAASAGITRGSLYALAVAPTSASTIFAGADDDNGGDVFKSTDGGGTWLAVSTGLTDARVHAIAVDPSTASTVYLGTRSAGVFKSTNGGASWSPSSLKATFVTALAVDPMTPATVYAGTDSSGLYKSTDGGTTWTVPSNALTTSTIHNLAIDPATPTTLYAATSTGVYKTADGGATWASANAGIFDENVNAVAISPRNPALLFAGTDSFGIFRSLNRGTYWLAANSGIPGATAGVSVTALTVDSASGTVYAAVGQSNVSRIYKSSDGVNWVPAGLASARVSAITVNGNSNTITTATVGGSEAFIAKWSASGALVYSTYFGGYRDDTSNAIAVDDAGNAVIAGTTSSLNFPIANPVQSVFAGGSDLVTDAFAAKLDPSASSIVWSTYLGGASDDFARAVAVDSNGNVYVTGQTGSLDFPIAAALIANRPALLNGFVAKIAANSTSATGLPYSIAARGGMLTTSQGGSASVSVGYAAIQPNTPGAALSGMAIFGNRQNGVLVSEAAVPSSPLIVSGRLYAEVSTTINTGVAMANPNAQPVTVNFHFTDATGTDFGQGSTVIPAREQIARFLNEAPFNGGSALMGTFTFTASQPVSVIALRGLTNARSEFLMTTLPVADLSIAPGSGAFVFPHYADGAGWTTKLLLLNTTDAPMSGSILFCGQAGCPAAVQPVASNAYTLPPRSSFQFQTTDAGNTVMTGSIQVTPASGSNAPTGVVVFEFNSGGVTVSTAGVPSSGTSNAFRMYAESTGTPGQSGSIQTGVAIANPGTAAATVVFELNSLSGASTGLTGSLSIPAGGQTALFLSQIPGFGALTSPFQGVLRVSTSSQGISVIGIRGRLNERGDFLMTTTQPTDENRPPTGPQFFPHFADGGGFTTQFILYNGGADQASSGSLQFFSQSGQPISLALQ
jgi:Beta-propeller repeat